MKRIAAAIFLVVIIVTTTNAQSEPETTWQCPDGFSGQALNIYNWDTFIGETTIEDFEQLCDVTINYSLFDNNAELIETLRSGETIYDLAFPTDFAIPILIGEGLLTPLDHTRIPNIENLSIVWRNPFFDPNNTYSIPYLYGNIGIIYNTDIIDEITSWKDVFEYPGPRAWIDDIRILWIGLNYLGLSVTTTAQNDIERVQDYFIEHSAGLMIAGDQSQNRLLAGEVDLALEYSGDAYQLIIECECDNLAYVIPMEGSIFDSSEMVIPANAANPDLAHVFIDYILNPTINARIVNDIGYATPNQAAIDSGLISPELLGNAIVFPDIDTLERLFFVEFTNETRNDYTTAWNEIAAATQNTSAGD